MNPDQPEVTVVVLTYNSAEIVGECLRTLGASGARTELIVVDNASSDDSEKVARETCPGATVIQTGRNLGFTANNLGILRARAPYVLILNPDALPLPGALRALVDFADAHPRAAIVAPRLLNPNGSLQHSTFRFPGLLQATNNFFGIVPLDSERNGRPPVDAYNRARMVEHTLGACMLVRASAIEAVGALDTRFFMYFEETDWCYRFREAGWEVWYTPDATAVHQRAHSTSRNKEAMSVEFLRSQKRYYEKHYSTRRQRVAELIRRVGVCYWALKTCVAFLRGRVGADLARRRFASYLAIARL